MGYGFFRRFIDSFQKNNNDENRQNLGHFDTKWVNVDQSLFISDIYSVIFYSAEPKESVEFSQSAEENDRT